MLLISITLTHQLYASSVTVYDTFGVNDFYQTGWAADVGYHLNTDHVMVANGFSVGANLSNVFLDTIEVALMNPFNNDGGSVMTMALYTDLNGEPGSILETFNITLAPQFSAQIYTLNSVLAPELFAGQNYWLVASAPDPLSELAWYWNGLAPYGAYTGAALTNSDLNNQWLDASGSGQQAFRITASVSEVPLPGAFALFLSCILGVSGFRAKTTVLEHFRMQST